MITILQNSLTRKKHTLNLIDHKGRVLGFNPYPGNHKVEWELMDEKGKDLIGDADIAIEKYLVGIPFHFGSDITFEVSQRNNSLNAINVDLVSDNLQELNHLTIHGEGGEYYIEDIGLSEADKIALFSKEAIEKWKNGRWADLYVQGLGNSSEKAWGVMTQEEKLESLLHRIEKLEGKVNLLGNTY